MERFYTTCAKCGKAIKYGNTYVSIVKNIEQANQYFVSDSIEVKILDSDDFLTLCEYCGNLIDTEQVKAFIIKS